MADRTAPLIPLSSGYGGGYSTNANYYSEAQELANAQKLVDMYTNAINTQYSAGIQNLQDQKEHLSEVYNPYRAQVSNQAYKSYDTLKENMANLGLDRSGHNLTMQTAIETNRQKNLQTINTQEQQAARDLQAQINEYIAQRDAAIANQTANVYQTAYSNISSFNQNMQIMATQHGYDKEMQAIKHNYDLDMARVEQEYKLAYMQADYQEQARLQKEMAAIEQSYNMQLASYKNQLDMQSYNAKAATDWTYAQKQAAMNYDYSTKQAAADYAAKWDYAQKQAALDYSYDSKKAADEYKYKSQLEALKNSGGSGGVTKSWIIEPNELSSKASQSAYNDIAKISNSTIVNSPNSQRLQVEYAHMDDKLDGLYTEKKISEAEFKYLLGVLDKARTGARVDSYDYKKNRYNNKASTY